VSFATPHDGAATQLRLGATQYTVSNIVVSFTNPNAEGGDDTTIGIAHLGQTTGEQAATMERPLIVPATGGAASGRQVTFDYIGKVIVSDAATGTYRITVAGSDLLGGTTASYYTVTSSTLTLATNDAIRGQAVITIAR
jgi:hypothetical protein